jgi:beta-lactam-binding protein with PASTA domain
MNDSGVIGGGQPELLVGSRFADRYVLTRLVSAGANTVIYDAVDTSTSRGVTLKVIQPGLAVVPTFRERFDRTVGAVAALSHPNIAAVYDWGEAPLGDVRTAFVVIEHLSGGSLRDMFDRGRRLSPSQALAVGLDVCKGLDHAHRRGFVHTELTPSKLVFGDDRRLRIVDFGLAALIGELAWSEPATLPTHVARYASPEQALSLPVNGTTDVYALCLAMVEAVTGRLPFAADSTVATLSARIGRLMPVSADLGPLASVLERAGRPDPDDRATAAEFGRGLVAAAEKLPRPEPLPLLSTGLFDMPPELLRDPEDPTGGVVRPGSAAAGLLVIPSADDPAPDALVVEDTGPPDPLLIVPAEPAAEPDAEPAAEPVAEPAAEPVADELVEEPDEPAADDVVVVPAEPDAEEPLVVVVADAARDDVDDAADADAPADDLVVVPAAPVPMGPGDGGPPAPRERRRRSPWIFIVPLLAVAALVALGVVAARLFSTPTYAVPALVGDDLDTAMAAIEDFDWEVTVESERSDAEPTVDHVVRTAPGAGERLAEGEPFLLVVSEGPVLRPLPDVTGRTLADAQTTLLELGLEVSVSEQHDETVPTGSVVSWSVPSVPSAVAGTEVEPGTEVALVSSIGPAPRTVPDLVGQPVEAARVSIEGLGLVVAEGEPVFDDVIAAGQVSSQTPTPGEQVERGATVQIVASKGPDLVAMPDLTGQTYDQAVVTLADAGLVANLVLGSTDGTFVSARVAGERVAPGDQHRRGTQVDLVFL